MDQDQTFKLVAVVVTLITIVLSLMFSSYIDRKSTKSILGMFISYPLQFEDNVASLSSTTDFAQHDC